MFNNNKKEINELREEIAKIRKEQMEFLVHANEIMKSVLDNDKRKFMYEIREEDVPLPKELSGILVDNKTNCGLRVVRKRLLEEWCRKMRS